MSDPRSLQQVLEQARRERPEALPRGFSLDVMDRIAHQANEGQRPPLRLLDFAVIGIAAVVVAGVVSLLVFPSQDLPGPPRLAVFGHQGSGSPFATP